MHVCILELLGTPTEYLQMVIAIPTSCIVYIHTHVHLIYLSYCTLNKLMALVTAFGN